MVIPADDQALVALSEHYHDLKDLAYISCPPPEITGLVLNKASTLEVARKCGLPIPCSKVISNSAELFDLRSSFPFPWVLKPVAKEVAVEEHKSYILESAEKVAARFPGAQEFTPPMLLQEFCAGHGVGVEILMHEGKPIAIFQHRRLKEFPYTGGVSVTAISEQPDLLLVEKSLVLLRAMQWEGPAMVEFKVNPLDGRAILMEVNGRYWGTIALPIFAGIDFPLYHWQLVHREAPTLPDGIAVGTKWTWTTGHIVRLHGLLVAARRSGSARKELLHSLAHFPACFGPFTRHALFSASDPMPVVVDLLHICKFYFLQDVKALSKHFAFRRQFAKVDPVTSKKIRS
jgi:predicted ATP-grasp superfamily ATP-dependent carboligase